MMFVSSNSTVAGVVVLVAVLSVEDESGVGKNKDSLVGFVAKRLKKNSHCLMS